MGCGVIERILRWPSHKKYQFSWNPTKIYNPSFRGELQEPHSDGDDTLANTRLPSLEKDSDDVGDSGSCRNDGSEDKEEESEPLLVQEVGCEHDNKVWGPVYANFI